MPSRQTVKREEKEKSAGTLWNHWIKLDHFLGKLEKNYCLLPPIGQWRQPQAEHSGKPLGDPNARVIEVFLLVSQSVR